MNLWCSATIAATVVLVAFGAAAQPQGVPFPPLTPEPRDVPYEGVITLEVDASDVTRGIFRVRELVPVAGPGTLTLLYPQWHPGKHAPRGAINLLAGLEVRANGELIAVAARSGQCVRVPRRRAGRRRARSTLTFQFVSPTQANQGRVVVTREMLNLQWEVALLYPAGHYASRIRVVPSVTLPDGWAFAVALDGAKTAGDTTRFAETDFETLVDSPLFAGQHYRLVDLDPGCRATGALNVFADRPDQLEATDEQLAAHRNLVQQAYRLFGSQHFDHYDFLFALSDRMGGIGLEHHRSSENGVAGSTSPIGTRPPASATCCRTRCVHSWNGKFRRPADLWTPNFETPMRGSLLWVYEGLDAVLGRRADGAFRPVVARAGARCVGTDGRDVPTSRRPRVALRCRHDQRSDPLRAPAGAVAQLAAQRGLLLRRAAGVARCRHVDSRAHRQSPLARRFRARILRRQRRLVGARDLYVRRHRGRAERRARRTIGRRSCASGSTRAVPSRRSTALRAAAIGSSSRRSAARFSARPKRYGGNADFSYSLGLSFGENGNVTGVQWDGPAFNQGVTVGTQVVAVNGVAFGNESLRRAITAASERCRPGSSCC